MRTLSRLALPTILILFFCSRAEADHCHVGGSSNAVFFVNGVNTDFLEARANLFVLRDELKNRIVGTSAQAACIHYELAYNPHESLFQDLREASNQILLGNLARFWRILSGLEPAPAWFQILAEVQARDIDYNSYVVDFDLQVHVAQYRAQISAGSKVIVVAHSQGNLYANSAFSILSTGSNAVPPDTFEIVAVATPASFVGGNGPYTTLIEDFIWQLPLVPAPLLANSTNGPACGFAWNCHTFVDSYLFGAISGPRILDDIIAQILRRPPPPPILPGCILTASPTAINNGEASMLSWTTLHSPTTAFIDNGIGSVDPVSGSLIVSPNTSVVYTLTISNSGGTATCSALVTVNVVPAGGGGLWNSALQMPTARAALASESLNGVIYTIGGSLDSSGISIVPTVEAYAVTNNSWTMKSPMPTPRALLAAAEIGGIIYVVGGCTGLFCTIPLATVEAYDPSTDQWMIKSFMPTARYGLTVTVVNGVLYAVGGANQNGILDTVESYDPMTNSWSTKAPMPTARRLATGGAINNLLYVIGGRDATDTATAVTEVYDPATNSWSAKEPMPTARGTLASGVSDAKLYAFGGFAGPGLPSTPALSTVEVYDPTTDAWAAVADMPTARGGLTVSTVSGVLFAIGGAPTPSASLALGVVEAFGPVTVVNYVGNIFPGMSSPPWVRLQPACPSGSGDSTFDGTAGSILEITDFDTACDHWFGRNNELDSTDDASAEWKVRVPFSSHPAAVVVGLSDGTKVIYVGHTSMQVGLLQQGASGSVGFLGSPIAMDASVSHTYRLVKNADQTVQLFVDGTLQQTFAYSSLPNFSTNSKQFFGAGSNFEQSQSFWESVSYTITRKP